MARAAVTAVVTNAEISMACFAGASESKDPDVAALKAHVADLELLVRQLLDERPAPAAGQAMAFEFHRQLPQ